MRGDIAKFKDSFAHHTELRFHENRNYSISSINGTITSNTQSSQAGVSARINHQGVWGFSSSSRLDDETVRKVIKEASNNTSFLSSKCNEIPLTQLPDKFHLEKLFITAKKRVSKSEMIDFVKSIDAYIEKKYPDLNKNHALL